MQTQNALHFVGWNKSLKLFRWVVFPGIAQNCGPITEVTPDES